MSTQANQVREIRGRFVIEAACDNNMNPHWSPNREKLRGRFDQRHIVGRPMNDALSLYLQAVPVTPGQCIEVDMEHRTLRIFDPLRYDTALWNRVEKAYAKLNNLSSSFFPMNQPAEDTVTTRANHNQIKEWLFCMRRWLDKGKAVEYKGSDPVPSYDDIVAMPGAVRAEFFNDIAPHKVVLEHVVPVPGE